jgi:hypothetical protein
MNNAVSKIDEDRLLELREQEKYENMGIIKSANAVCNTVASDKGKIVCDDLMHKTLMGEMGVQEYLGTLETKFSRNKILSRVIDQLKQKRIKIPELEEIHKEMLNKHSKK